MSNIKIIIASIITGIVGLLFYKKELDHNKTKDELKDVTEQKNTIIQTAHEGKIKADTESKIITKDIEEVSKESMVQVDHTVETFKQEIVDMIHIDDTKPKSIKIKI